LYARLIVMTTATNELLSLSLLEEMAKLVTTSCITTFVQHAQLVLAASHEFGREKFSLMKLLLFHWGINKSLT